MAEIVNLGKFRKQKTRASKKAQADANAVAFGRTKAEKAADAQRDAKAQQHLDGHRREEDEA